MKVSILTRIEYDPINKKIEDFLEKDHYCYESVKNVLDSVKEMVFDVTDSIDVDNLGYVCMGRAREDAGYHADLNSDCHWNYWVYILKNNKWIKIEDYYAS